MQDPAELAMLREQTKSYIDYNPSTITLTRNIKVPDGSGGYTTAPTLLAPQVFRVIQQRESAGTESRNVDGEVVDPSLTLLAEWDADVQEGDTFTWRTWTAEVKYVTDMKYELSCELALE